MNKIKKIKNYLLAFIIPFIICLIVFGLKNILGDIENLYVSDLKLQHLVFLNYLKNIFTGDASIFYSFYAGMGNSMLSTIIFYCVSPVNLLLLLFKDIRYAIMFIYIVKVSLSGLTMFMLLKKKTGKNTFSTVLFSSCYAVSSFVINYFFCVFWFDVLYLAPLVVMGIDKIIEEEKINLLYIISLSMAIICNIQMGFGLCVFAVVYYLYSYNINYSIKKDFNKFKQLGILFLISSLCAGAISIGALLGFVGDYDKISAARDIQVTTRAGTTNILYVLKNLFSVGSLKTDYFNNFEPYVYCGLIVSFFSLLFLFNSKIEKKKRVGALVVILVFCVSFSINFINLFWHLSSPVLLNYRYSIYLGLFLTMIAYECYLSKDRLDKKDIVVLSILLLIAFFMMLIFSLSTYVIYTFVFLILIFGMIIYTKNKNKKLEFLLFLVVLLEIGVSSYLSIYTSSQFSMGKFSTYDSLLELESYNEFDDDYRVIYNYTYADYTNDSLLLNNGSSLRYFSSILSGDLAVFFDRNLTNVGNNNYRVSGYDSPVLTSLLGNKYFYLTSEFNNSIYKKVDSYEVTGYDYEKGKIDTKDVYLYENPYALSLGYVIEDDVDYDKSMDVVDYQNAIMKAFTGNGMDVLRRLSYVELDDSEVCNNTTYYSCKSYEITNDTDNILTYVYSLFNRYNITNNSQSYIDINKPLVISTLDKKINLSLEYEGILEGEHFAVMTYDKESLINGLSYLRENMMTDIKIDKNVMTGKLNTSKGGILFLSIPYEEGFEILVDGKKTEYYPLLDNSFIGLDMSVGEHDIEISYVDNRLYVYILLTIVSSIITVTLYYFINKVIDKRKKEELLIQQQLEEKKQKNKNKKTKSKKKK